MRAMLLGAGGMLGHDLVANAPAGTDAHAVHHAERDVTDHRGSPRLHRGRPRPDRDVVINATAYTAVDRAESPRPSALLSTPSLSPHSPRSPPGAASCSSISALTTCSTGRRLSPITKTQPRTRSTSMARASWQVRKHCAPAEPGSCSCARSGCLGCREMLSQTMCERAKAGLATKVVADQIGRPTCTRDLARVTWTLVDRQAAGVFHVANEGEATWFDVAAHIFSRAGRRDLVRPCTSSDYPTAARRPRYSALDTKRRALARSSHALVFGRLGSLPSALDTLTRPTSSPMTNTAEVPERSADIGSIAASAAKLLGSGLVSAFALTIITSNRWHLLDPGVGVMVVLFLQWQTLGLTLTKMGLDQVIFAAVTENPHRRPSTTAHIRRRAVPLGLVISALVAAIFGPLYGLACFVSLVLDTQSILWARTSMHASATRT